MIGPVGVGVGVQLRSAPTMEGSGQESLKEANELFQEWAKAVSNQEQEINLSIL